MDKQSFRKSPEYKLWRRRTWYRDGYRCRVCSSKVKIEAHHIYPAKKFLDKIYEVTNGITLCRKHHRAIKGKELLLAPYLQAIIENDVKSVNTPPSKVEGNTEPSLAGNSKEGVTTRSRDFHIDQFISKQVKCSECGKKKKVPYYRTQTTKQFVCGQVCRKKMLSKRYTGILNKKPPIKNVCLWCGKETKTPSSDRRKKKFCNNTCQMAHWNNQVGWSRKAKKCVVCGTTETKHKGNGMCKTCHRTNRYKVSNASKSASAERQEIV